MKQLLLVTPYYSPDTGACAARCSAITNIFETENIPYTVVVPSRKTKTGNSSVFRLPLHLSYTPHLFFQDVLKIYKKTETINISGVISTYPSALLSFQAFLIAKLRNTDFYLDMRDLVITDGIKGKVTRVLEKILVTQAQRIFVTTKQQKALLQKKYALKTNNIVVIPNGVSDSLIALTKESSQEKNIDLIFSGTIVPERDPEGILAFLTHLVKLFPQVKVTFVGLDLKSPIVTEFVSKVKTIPFKNPPELLPQLSQEDAFKKVLVAKTGLVSLHDNPNNSYQIPVKIYEYLAAATPIIALLPKYENAIQKYIDTYNTGLSASDPVILAKKTAKLLQDNKTLTALQKKSLNQSSQHIRSKHMKVLAQYVNKK